MATKQTKGLTWVDKLVTKDDPLQVHKSIGILCMLSYLVRFYMGIFHDIEMGFATYPQWTIPTLLLHTLLNVSAFQFHVPKKRIVSGFRIWPEYIQQQLAFIIRSVGFLAIVWYEQVYELEPIYAWNYVLVFTTLAAASLSSWANGKYHSESIRDLELPPWVKYLFSAGQLVFTVHILMGVRSYHSNFWAIMVGQVNSFMMTLRRKNLGGHYFFLAVYGIGLVVGVTLFLLDFTYLSAGPNTACVGIFLAQLAILLRAGIRLPLIRYIQDNKFIMWAMITIMLHFMRPNHKTDEPPAWLSPEVLRILAYAPIVPVLATGWWKQVKGRKNVAETPVKTE